MDYLDNVLIKLRRRYSKEEALSAIIKKCSELEFENGVLKSEVDELKYLLNKKEDLLLNDVKKEISNKIHRKLNSKLQEKDKTIKTLRESVRDLANKLSIINA